MNKKNVGFLSFLFFLFFAFQWSAQYATARLASGGSRLFLVLMYGCFFMRLLVWMEILRDMKLISAYCVSSLSYLIVPFLSWLVMGEPYSSSYAAGGILILAGISLFAIGEQRCLIPGEAI